MIKLLHVISGLATGGAEMMLYKLLSRINRRRFAPSVLVLSGERALEDRIARLGIPVEILGMRRRLPRVTDIVRLTRRLDRMRPALIQTWMYHSNLAVGLAGFFSKLPPIIWGIRASSPRSPIHRPTTALTIRLSALLSRSIPHKILYCSRQSCEEHVRFGYDRRKSLVIPNGFDLRAFRPRRAARAAVRERLGLPPDAPLIGMAARFHPQKDFPTFARAAATLLKRIPDVHFLLCGQGITAENGALVGLLKEQGVERRFHLLGVRDDVPQLMAALDIASLSSSSLEAFPNVIGEAMACGISCVATDVGDTAFIIGKTGDVVPPSDPGALAAAWERRLTQSLAQRRTLGLAAYRRIQSEFAIDSVVRRYEAAYLDILSKAPAEPEMEPSMALRNRSTIG